jgi:hypothetical protein
MHIIRVFKLNLCCANRFTTASLLLLFILLSGQLFAQKHAPLSMSALYARLDTFRNKLPAEKLYLHLDKPQYATGDTIWFKAYLLDGTTHAYSHLSGLLYVELLNDSGRLVERTSIPLKFGLGFGQLGLTDPLLLEGSYTLRAYTNWMQNFGDACFFTQRMYIARQSDHLLVKERHQVTNKLDGRYVDLSLQFGNADHKELAVHDLSLKITDGRRVLSQNKITTGVDGSFSSAFKLPEKFDKKNINILVEDVKDPALRSNIPLNIHDAQNIDLQFMPDGGHLVAGIPSLVGFKAIAEDGLAADVDGAIIDSKNKQVAVFKSMHKGMGSFELNPVAGELYSAVIKLPGGKQKTYALPKVADTGTVLHIDNNPAKDSLMVSIQTSPNMANNQICNLLALSRGINCYSARIILKENTITSYIAKSLFPTGIVHFVIIDQYGQAINERLTFINNHDELAVSVKADEQSYRPHDSVSVNIFIADKKGEPVSGSFSVAVTDNSQVKADTSNTLLTNMLLTSDLKGYVEDPAYYFGNSNAQQQALDNLLLTQGWVGYNWDAILKDKITIAYHAEEGLNINGRVSKFPGGPMKNAKVLLISPSTSFLRDTVSDQKGQFRFANLPLTDTLDYVVQATTKGGGTYGVTLAVDEFKPAVFAKQDGPVITPWYVNSDTLSLKSLANRKTIQQQSDKLKYGDGNRMLKEVVIKGTKVVKGSQNLNGPGESDLAFDEQDLLKAGKKSLLNLLVQKVPGFKRKKIPYWYYVDDKFVWFVFDGQYLYRSGQYNDEQSLTYLLANTSAEDIEGIEVMSSSKHVMDYIPVEFRKDLSPADHAFIEITTRSGNGPVMSNTPGIYHYKPVPVTLPKEFYAPKYTAQAKNTLPDLRSTIHWEPNLVTDERGEAQIFFYAADEPSSYTLILQGTDLKGNLAFKTIKINIKPK